MKPFQFAGYQKVLGEPPGWDAKKHGKCGGLPVLVRDGVCMSAWQPTWRERLAILLGSHILLHVFSGQTQPPVDLQVQRLAIADYPAPATEAKAMLLPVPLDLYARIVPNAVINVDVVTEAAQHWALLAAQVFGHADNLHFGGGLAGSRHMGCWTVHVSPVYSIEYVVNYLNNYNNLVNNPCEWCIRKDYPDILDEDGMRAAESGKPGLWSHAHEDAWWPCPRFEPEAYRAWQAEIADTATDLPEQIGEVSPDNLEE